MFELYYLNERILEFGRAREKKVGGKRNSVNLLKILVEKWISPLKLWFFSYLRVWYITNGTPRMIIIYDRTQLFPILHSS